MKDQKYIGEAQRRSAEMRAQGANKKGYASGGRVSSYPHMRFGAGNGSGRLEKVEEYGSNAYPKGKK